MHGRQKLPALCMLVHCNVTHTNTRIVPLPAIVKHIYVLSADVRTTPNSADVEIIDSSDCCVILLNQRGIVPWSLLLQINGSLQRLCST
jgi:hypothetical protein